MTEAIAFDTHKFIKNLTEHGFTEEDGRTAVGAIPSTLGARIIASAVFLDFGIVDAITDKHRKYPDSFVVPIQK